MHMIAQRALSFQHICKWAIGIYETAPMPFVKEMHAQFFCSHTLHPDSHPHSYSR